MKKVLALLLIFVLPIFAQDGGKTGLTFLKLGADAAELATSDLGVVSAEGTAALFYNPAFLNDSLAFVSFSHDNYLQDVSAENLGVTFNLWGMPLGLAFSTTSINGIEVRTRPGAAQGDFSVHYFTASVSTALDLFPAVRFGITGKYLYEGMLADEASGYAFDAGLKVKSPFKNVLFGMAIRNVGKMDNLRSKPTEVPTVADVGASYKISFDRIQTAFLFDGGVRKYLKESPVHLHFGVETIYRKMFAIRLGYATGYDSKSLSAGLGIKWRSFSFDYAFVPYDYNLGTAHLITVGADISGLF